MKKFFDGLGIYLWIFKMIVVGWHYGKSAHWMLDNINQAVDKEIVRAKRKAKWQNNFKTGVNQHAEK